MHHPTDRITHTTAFVTPVVEHRLEREIAQWVHPMKDRSDDPTSELHPTHMSGRKEEIFYLMMDRWLKTTEIMREKRAAATVRATLSN